MSLSAIYQLYRGGHFLLVEETGVPRENHWFVVKEEQIYHLMLYRVHLVMSGIRTHIFSGDYTDCIWSRPRWPLNKCFNNIQDNVNYQVNPERILEFRYKT